MHNTNNENTMHSTSSHDGEEPRPKLDPPRLQRDDGDKSLQTFTRKAVSVRGSASIILLYQHIQERQWEKIFDLLEKNEHVAKTWIEEFNTDGSLRWRSLPMHLICEKDPPLEIVGEFLRLYPQSLLQKNHGQELPIHIVCRQGAAQKVIRLLLENRPETAKIPDCEGRLPLHLACCNDMIDPTSIEDLILYHERAIRTPDDFGLLPLHWACTKKSPAVNVEAVIKAYPFAIEHKDCYGKTPMDRIRSHEHPEKAKIVELLSRDVSSWSKGMMSTIVELSSKVGSYEEMKHMLEQKEEECMDLKAQKKQCEKEVKYLTNKWHKDKQDFKEEIHQMQRSHLLEIKESEEKFRSQISGLKREKEASEKKVLDLKVIVDELVEQLKEQNSGAQGNSSSRKELKAKVVELLEILKKTQRELDKVKDENIFLTAQLKKYGRSSKSNFDHGYDHSTFDRGTDRNRGYNHVTHGMLHDDDDSFKYILSHEERSP